MASEDLCPATGETCRDPDCERGGCREIRGAPARSSAAKPAQPDPALKEEVARLMGEVGLANSRCGILAAALREAVAELDKYGALLSWLHKGIGHETSPRFAELRAFQDKTTKTLNRLTESAAARFIAERSLPPGDD